MDFTVSIAPWCEPFGSPRAAAWPVADTLAPTPRDCIETPSRTWEIPCRHFTHIRALFLAWCRGEWGESNGNFLC